MAALPGGDVAVLDPRRPSWSAPACTRAEIAAFLAGARAGEFDDLG